MIKRASKFLIGAVAAVAVISVLWLVLTAQFRVYQKKHGPHMTVLDWLLDSEVKR